MTIAVATITRPRMSWIPMLLGPDEEQIDEYHWQNHYEPEGRAKFFVRYHHRSYRPDGFAYRIAAEDRLMEVMAATPEGALKLAEYHHFLFGQDFRLESRPVVARSRHTVVFAPLGADAVASEVQSG